MAEDFNDKSTEGEVSGLRAIVEIEGLLQMPVRQAGKLFEGDPPDKVVKDQLKVQLTEAAIREMLPGVEEPELKDDTFTFWLSYALPGHQDASPQSAYKRGFCKSAEAINQKRGNMDAATGKPMGWKSLVGQRVVMRQTPISWKISDPDTGEKKETKSKTWTFVDDSSTPADLDAIVAGLIAGKDKSEAMRIVVMDSKVKRDPKYKEAIKAGQSVAGMELVDGVYKKVA